MASKRQRKKTQKRIEQNKLLKSGYSEKQVKKLNTESRQKAYKLIIQKEHKNEKARQRYNEKKKFIESNHLSHENVTPNSSWNDIKKAKRRYQTTRRKTNKFQELLSKGVSEEEARKLVFGKKEITWKEINEKWSLDNRVFNISPKAFAIGYRDFSENLTIAEIYSYSNYLSIETLRESLSTIVHMKPTFSKRRKSKSSGKAGDYKYHFGSIRTAENFPYQRGCEHYSFFRSNGSFAIHKFTLDNMMVLVHAIMNNILEDRRQPFYNKFYKNICSVIPQAKDYFPSP